MGKSNHEELLGGAPEATSNKQTVEDNLLGRPHVAEKSFAPEAKKDALAPKTPEERFAELQRLTSVYLSEDDEAMLAKAFRFASEAHEGQCRKSGEPFVAHPVEVAIILADLRMDVETLCAALLHDTVEDTSVTRDQVEAEFNPQVAQLVEGVTKITRIEVESLTDEQAATIRKMFVAMSKDIRVIVIKLADRLHNMRTLGALREDRRIFKARETLEIYAPIAHRLGINNIKWELEDLSFYYLEPNKYKQVSRMVTESRAEREGYLDQIIGILHDEMEKVGITAQIMGRPKHLYSIYQKMTQKEMCIRDRCTAVRCCSGSWPTASQTAASSSSCAAASGASHSGSSATVRRFQPDRARSRHRFTVTRNSHAFRCSGLSNAVSLSSSRRNTSWYTSSASARDLVWPSASRYTASPQSAMACLRNASGCGFAPLCRSAAGPRNAPSFARSWFGMVSPP